MRRAQLTFDVVESGDDITLHFEDDRFPPLWFNKHHRTAGWTKLHSVLDEFEVVEEIPDRRAS
jgi:hypothetical protein